MSNEQDKICKDCSKREGKEVRKPKEEFARNGTTKDRLQPYCKKCGVLRAAEYGRRKGLTYAQYIKYCNEKKMGVSLAEFKKHYGIKTPDVVI